MAKSAPARPVPIRQSSQPATFGLPADKLGVSIENYPVAKLRPYKPKWVWPPTFEGTDEFERLLKSIKVSGIFHPLLILRDGQVVDGRHRLACARELGLKTVPVRVLNVPVPLKDLDRLAIEEFAVRDAVARRHLTQLQAEQLFLDLLSGRTEVQGREAGRANPKKGAANGTASTAASSASAAPASAAAGAVRNLGVDELAERVGWSKRSTERAITVLKHAPSEVVTKLKNREISLGGAERAMREVAGRLRPPAEKRLEKSSESSTSSSTTARAATTTLSARGKDAAARAASEPPPAAPSPLLPQKADDLIESPIEAVADTFIARLESLIPKAERWPQAAHPRLERALSRLSESLIDAVERLETPR